MKNLSLFVSAFALCASTSSAAINCSTLPSCSSLGYTDTVSQCPDSKKVLKCPFDTTQGKCIYDAAVGAVQYFPFLNPGGGWLKCDGATFTQAQYPDLYAKIGQTFCTAAHGGTCGNGVGRLPKYTGFFLRVQGSPASVCGASNGTLGTFACTANSSLGVAVPQVEGLPNITGKGGWFDDPVVKENDDTPASKRVTGAFYLSDTSGAETWAGSKDYDRDNTMMNFDASKSNTVYGRQNGVIPANYAVYAYIYAGKKAQ